MSSRNDKFTGPYVPRSKYSKKAFFAYLPKESSFQQGYLGIGRQSIIAGVFHLRYSDEKPIFVKKVQVSFTGKECIYFTSRLLEEEEKKEQKNGNHHDDSDDDDDNDDYCNNNDGSAAMISNHRAKRKIFQASICLWKSQHKGHYEGVKSLDLPFKLKLPDDLPPSICIDKGYGRIYYVLKAEVSRQPINPESRNRNKVIKVVVPIARFSLISPVLSSRWLVKNEKPASLHVVGYDISLSNSIFKPNTKVVIPVKLYFYEPHVYLKNIMVGLKEYHELRTNKHEILVKNYLIQKTVTPSLHLIPSFNPDNGYHLEISFMIPPERLLAYTVDSTYLTVSHKIKIKVNLGRAPDISLSKSVKIENVVSEDEIISSLPDKIETPEIVRTSYTSSKYSTPNRLSPYLPAILNKFYALDPIAKKRLSKQLQRHIADSKNSGTIYNSRTVIIP